MSDTASMTDSPPHQPSDTGADAKTDSFCVHLWNHLRLQSDGEAQVCCIFQGGNIAHDGTPMTLQRHSLEEIWNSDMLRGVRRDMVEGRPVRGCEQCYKEEARGGMSMRLRDNANFEHGWLNESRTRIEDLKSLTAQVGFRAPALPAMIEIDTGSLCNLKCRMCHDGVSSLIAKDPVHSSWTADQYTGQPYHNEAAQPNYAKLRRFLPLKSALDAELSKHQGEIKRLYFIGGEPLLVRELRPLLEGLVSSGHSRDIELAIVSNGSLVPPWLSLASQFRRLELAVSIDGFGKNYDYIRYPARWDELSKNLELLKQIPNVLLSGAVTIQMNNALNITDLFRYFDSIGIGFYAYPLSIPRYLSIDTLPPEARRLSAERLKAYANGDCLPHHREMVLANAAQIESNSQAAPDPRLVREFMLFTNDLDVSREQSIRRTDPELVQLLTDAGFHWIQETLHAGRVRAATADLSEEMAEP